MTQITKKICSQFGAFSYAVLTLPRRTRRLPRALGERERQKHNCVVQKVTNVHQKRN